MPFRIESRVDFVKMHGAGNDFVVIDGRYGVPFEREEFAVAVCDRRFGVGADGLLLLRPSKNADFFMEYYNADGSRSVCGNGIRCIARFVLSLGLFPIEPVVDVARVMRIETDGGISKVEVIGRGDRFCVGMGVPRLDGGAIPTAEPGRHLGRELVVGDEGVVIYCVGMGNPHCVIFVEDVSTAPVLELGPAIENHPFFPERTNVEFVQVIDRHRVRVRVWERGCGETLACGTGNCAVLAAAVLSGRSERRIRLASLGGEFEVWWSEEEGEMYLTGPAEEVFRGSLVWEEVLYRRRDRLRVELLGGPEVVSSIG